MAGGGLRAGASAMYNNTVPKPTPFTTPKRKRKDLNDEADVVINSPELDGSNRA